LNQPSSPQPQRRHRIGKLKEFRQQSLQNAGRDIEANANERLRVGKYYNCFILRSAAINETVGKAREAREASEARS